MFAQIIVFRLLLSIQVSAICKVTWHLYPAVAKTPYWHVLSDLGFQTYQGWLWPALAPAQGSWLKTSMTLILRPVCPPWRGDIPSRPSNTPPPVAARAPPRPSFPRLCSPCPRPQPPLRPPSPPSLLEPGVRHRYKHGSILCVCRCVIGPQSILCCSSLHYMVI